jgi:3-phytase
MHRLISAAIAVPIVLLPTAAAAAPPAPRPAGPATVTARLETPALFDDEAGGDADADDPAIWVHPTDRARSLVVATAKNGGLRVYDLAGREVQSIATPAAPGPDDESGRFNNVDLVSGFRLGGRSVDLAVVSDRGRDQLRFYRIDPVAGRLVDVTAAAVPFAFNTTQAEIAEQRTAYGLATWKTGDGAFALVSRRSTPEVGLFELVARGATVTYRRADSLTLPDTFRLPDGTSWSPCADPGDGPQVEGSVVDAENEVAYLAQETVGLWRVPLDDDGEFDGRPTLVERTREFGVPASFDVEQDECVVDHDADPGFGGRIAADVEGLTIHPTAGREGTLLVSSQGDSTFFRYDRRSNRRLGQFVVAGPGTDGSQHCDGAAVTPVALPGFPGGLLVVQDGENTPGVPGDDGEARANTNFKFVDAGFLRR